MSEITGEAIRKAYEALSALPRRDVSLEEWAQGPSLTLEHLQIQRLLDLVPLGDRIEFGVYYAQTLAIMSRHHRRTIGVDSFEGMAESGPRDLLPDGSDPYPKGRLTAQMEEVRRRCPSATLVKGWVPEVFEVWLWKDMPISGPYAFAHVDLDHYQPTLDTIRWLWDRMLPGGIICCDDWFEGRDYLAAAAINEWAEDHPLDGTLLRKAWWVR